MSDEREPMERAFVAVSYLLDRRGRDLGAPLGSPSAGARRLSQALSHPERQSRAVVLAREVAHLVVALDERRLT